MMIVVRYSYQTTGALSRVPSAIFRRNARVARRTYTEYVPAGTPHTSARNLTLGVGYYLH